MLKFRIRGLLLIGLKLHKSYDKISALLNVAPLFRLRLNSNPVPDSNNITYTLSPAAAILEATVSAALLLKFTALLNVSPPFRLLLNLT